MSVTNFYTFQIEHFLSDKFFISLQTLKSSFRSIFSDAYVRFKLNDEFKLSGF